VEHPRRVVGVDRLPVDPAVEDDRRVDAECDPPVEMDRARLALRVSEDELRRIGVTRVVLDVLRRDDLERDSELLEDRAPLRRGRGERQRVLRATQISSIGQFRAQAGSWSE
jgi:hypothetical protein